MSSRQSSSAASSILPAGAPPPVSARPVPILIGSAACAAGSQSKPAISAALAHRAVRARFVILSSLDGAPTARRSRDIVRSCYGLLLAGFAIRIDQLAGLALWRPHAR